MSLMSLSVPAPRGGVTSVATTNLPSRNHLSRSETGSPEGTACYSESPCHHSGCRIVLKTLSQTSVLFTVSPDRIPPINFPVPTFLTCRTTSPHVSVPTLFQSSGGSTSRSVSSRPVLSALL